jgi:stearoyl-CoA desaturase (delta-9 desaturase)
MVSSGGNDEATDATTLYLSPDNIPGRVAETQALTPAALRYERTLFFLANALPVLGTIVAFARLPKHPFTVTDGVLVVGLYLVNLCGIEVGFHRLFSHHAFEAKPWVRVVLAAAGALAVQGPVMYWVAHHRRHHQRSDRPGDPHSPRLHGPGFFGALRGFWHAHVGWLFSSERASAGYYARDIMEDTTIRFVDGYYNIWMILTLAIPTAIGFAASRTVDGAVDGLLWGGFFRVLMSQTEAYSVNSIGHSIGSRPFESRDSSRNSLFFMLVSAGGSLHNAHHAFPSSARTSLRWFELDPAWWVIRCLELCGQVTDVRVPSPMALKRRLRTASSGKPAAAEEDAAKAEAE